MIRPSALFLIFLFIGFASHAQTSTGKKKKFLADDADHKIFDKGEYYFDQGNYALAMVEYKKLEVEFPEEGVLIYRIGVCYVNSHGEKERSLDYLGKLDPDKFRKTDLLFYLGRANHLNYQFDKAIDFYTRFKESKRGKEKQKVCDRLIENCTAAKELYAHPTKAEIVNIGPPVNTQFSEYGPTVSSDEATLIYTYLGPRCKGGLQKEPGVADSAGQYFEDILVSLKDSAGHWTFPEPIDEINTNGPDAAISLSNDGQKLLVFKNSAGDVGDIYLSRLEGSKWSEPEPLRGDVNTTAWEGSASFSPDEHTLYFSSERPGGFGGKDIYSATLQDGGSWGNVKNLGPTINTEYDDDSPIMHPDGVSLYFNSVGHTNMGGNDIFVSMLKEDSTWSEPENLGYPVNTPDDDLFFFPVGNGDRGYYSSGQKGGFGQQDIYRVDGLGRKVKFVMVKGVVTVDDKAVDASIIVLNEKKGTQVAFHSNSVTGKYLVNLAPNTSFKLQFKAPGFEDQVKTMNTLNVDSFMESTMDVQFYTEAFKNNLKRIHDSISLVKDTAKAKAGTAGMSLAEVIAKYGDSKVEGLEFRVQIGAFNLKDNFNYGGLLKLGKVQKNKGEDGITRFTIGHKATLNEIYTLKKKVIDAGIKDAFVVTYYQKKRISLREVITQNLFQKP